MYRPIERVLTIFQAIYSDESTYSRSTIARPPLLPTRNPHHHKASREPLGHSCFLYPNLPTAQTHLPTIRGSQLSQYLAKNTLPKNNQICRTCHTIKVLLVMGLETGRRPYTIFWEDLVQVTLQLQPPWLTYRVSSSPVWRARSI